MSKRMIGCNGAEFTPWYGRLERHVGPKARHLSLKEMFFYLRNCIIKPAILQCDTFFSMYAEYSTITDLPRIRILQEVFNIPAAHLKILYKQGLNLPVVIFEYDVEFQISPEDRDYLLVQTSGFVPVEVQNELIHKNSSYRHEHEEMYGCVTAYPSLFDCEKVTSEDLTMDFTHRFINATEILLDRCDDDWRLPLL